MFFILHKIDCKIKKMYKNTLIKKNSKFIFIKKNYKSKKSLFRTKEKNLKQ